VLTGQLRVIPPIKEAKKMIQKKHERMTNKRSKLLLSLLVAGFLAYASPLWAENFKSGHDLVSLMEYYEKAQSNAKEVNWRAFEFRAYVVGAFDAMSWQYEIPKKMNVQEICDLVVRHLKSIPMKLDRGGAVIIHEAMANNFPEKYSVAIEPVKKGEQK
jgi:hypothetical protein